MTYTTPSLPLTLRLCVACCSTCSIPVFFHLYFLGAAVLGVHSTGAVSSLPLPQPTTVAAKAAATVMPYLTVRPQRTVKLASFAPRSAPALHAFARPRRRSPLVGGLTLPASRVLHSFSPSRRLPALPPRFQGTRGFHPPVCAAPYPPGCGATSSLLLSNICIQLLSTLAAVRGWRLARRAGEGRAADGHLECRENRLCSHSKVRVHYAYDFYGLSPDLRLRVLASSRSTRRAPSYTSKYGSVRTPLAWGGAQG